MIATNTVKINGVLYRAGDELPCPSPLNSKIEEKVEETPIIENKDVEVKTTNKGGRPRKNKE